MSSSLCTKNHITDDCVWTVETGPCFICGQRTNRVDICFEARLCWGWCATVADASYWQALTATQGGPA